MKQALTDIWRAIIYVLNGPKPDPKRFAKEPPEWWHGHARAESVPEREEIQRKEGGFAVGFDGQLIYSTGETVAEAKGWRGVDGGNDISEQDYGEMIAYTPKLTNVVLAKRIKPLWRQGKKYRDIAALVGVSEQYVKYYASCFERAKKASNASPIECPGEGH